MPIDAQGLEIQIGARTLLHPTNFHVTKGDKIGLVGRNGAGKTGSGVCTEPRCIVRARSGMSDFSQKNRRHIRPLFRNAL